jgi:hypothetical protein
MSTFYYRQRNLNATGFVKHGCQARVPIDFRHEHEFDPGTFICIEILSMFPRVHIYWQSKGVNFT